MIEDILPILVISAIISGVIGLFLGSSVNKGFAGFFLGLFLGPIGWIIVLLLPRETSNSPQTPAQTPTQTQTAKEIPSSQKKAAEKGPPRDLTSDAYKIWLGKKYEITRNELFDNFECDEKLFESLDDALKYADELEAEERQRLIEKEKETETEKAGYVLASEYAEQNSISVEQTVRLITYEKIEGRVFDGDWYMKIFD